MDVCSVVAVVVTWRVCRCVCGLVCVFVPPCIPTYGCDCMCVYRGIYAACCLFVLSVCVC